MRKLLSGLCAVLVCAAVYAAETGGFPSQPIFQSVKVVVGSASNAMVGAWTTGVERACVESNQTAGTGVCGMPATRSGVSTFVGPLFLHAGSGTILTDATTVPWGAGPIYCTTACNVSAIKVGQQAIIQKGANTTRTSNTTLTADPDLQFTNLPTGIFAVSMTAYFSAAAASGDQLEISDGGGAVTSLGGPVNCNNSTITLKTMRNGAATCVAGGGASTDIYGISNEIFGETSGATLAVKWAQQTSSGGNLVLNNGAYFSITRIQ